MVAALVGAVFAEDAFGEEAVFFMMGEAVFFTFVRVLDGAFDVPTVPDATAAVPAGLVLVFFCVTAMMTTPLSK